MSTIVFLHIPKTAGQTIHNELVRLVGGEAHVSPIRVHSQAPNGPQMPAGYRLYSGHLDWVELDSLPQDRFVFTVLRDPRERIASYYLYLLREAQTMSAEILQSPRGEGYRRLLEASADDYFFGGDDLWQLFILDHYDNFYCSYFASRRMRRRRFDEYKDLSDTALLACAVDGLAALDGVYSTNALEALEQDVQARFGQKIRVAGNYFNTGGHALEERRWPKLLERFESDSSAQKLDRFVHLDMQLMQRFGIGDQPTA